MKLAAAVADGPGASPREPIWHAALAAPPAETDPLSPGGFVAKGQPSAGVDTYTIRYAGGSAALCSFDPVDLAKERAHLADVVEPETAHHVS